MISSTNQSTDRSLAGWLDCRRTAAPRPRGSAEARQPDGGLRFAFYGRISTADFQDRASSRQWQRDSATELITGRGTITAEYFDVGCSRSLRWAHRPQAANLLNAVANPDRGFDAIVIGEYERAFATDQLTQLLPMLERHQVQLWLPETASLTPAHTRNRAHARWGRRLHRLDPDPATAPREIDQHPSPVVHRSPAAAGQSGRHRVGQPDPVGQHPQQRRAHV